MAIQKNIKTWLLIAFAIETLSATFGLALQSLSSFLSITWFISGLGIAVLVLFMPLARWHLLPLTRVSKQDSIIKSLLFLSLIFFLYFLPRYWMDMIPIDPDYADMLPVINIMNQRFLHGNWHQVYDPIPGIWNSARPIYLPAMWLPYVLSVKLDIDMRWTTVACLFFVFGLFLSLLRFRARNFSNYFLLGLGIVLFFWLLAFDDVHNLISMSEEGVVIFYYGLLVMALLSGNIIFTGIMASLCMLSRYAVIGWIPAFLLLLVLEKRKKQILVLTVTGLSCFLILFILPFGWQPFADLLQLPGSYVDFAKKVWVDSRAVIWFSLGFAKFFGPQGVEKLHSLLLLLTFSLPPVFVAVCFYFKKKISNIPLATLKLTVMIFYNFIDVPFLYLFYTSSVISLLITGYFIGYQDNRPVSEPRSTPCLIS